VIALAEARRSGRDDAWHAGREAAREALRQLLGALPASLEIVRAADGAPEVRGLVAAPWLSISHGRERSVAAASWHPIGIDLCDEHHARSVRRVATRFLSVEEGALAQAAGSDAAWAALWALKEAAAKALRVGLLAGGLRKSRLASLEPPRFAWPALEAQLVRAGRSAIAVVGPAQP